MTVKQKKHGLRIEVVRKSSAVNLICTYLTVNSQNTKYISPPKNLLLFNGYLKYQFREEIHIIFKIWL